MQTIRWILFTTLVLVLSGELFMVLHIGYMSDDYALMHAANHNEKLWDLHYSPPLVFLWHTTAFYNIPAWAWHLGIFIVHTINTALIYVLTSRYLHLSPFYALCATILYALSPSGLEALAWTCCAGYVLSLLFILIALTSFLAWKDDSTHLILKALWFASVQAAAMATWSWGGLVFPIVAVYALAIARRRLLMLIPMGIVWAATALLRAFSGYSIRVQDNSVSSMLQYVVGAPLLSLFPNLDKSLIVSVYGLALLAGVGAFLLWAAYKNRIALASLACFFIALGPWIINSNPSSRYFYIAAPFLYLTIAVGLSTMRHKTLAYSLAAAFLCVQGFFTWQRATLWIEAYNASENLMSELAVIVEKAPVDKQLVVINLPDSYGPEEMPMRPQLWYTGYNQRLAYTGKKLTVVKTVGSPFIFQKQPNLVDREKALADHQDDVVFEVVQKSPGQGFAVVARNTSQ